VEAVARNAVKVSGIADGQPMVFAHGFGCDSNMWRFVAPRYEQIFKVVTLDYVGHGESDRSAYDPQKYSNLGGYATDIIEICDALGLSEVLLVGHSVSAMVGALACIRRPDLFARLVMVGPSPRYIDDDGYVGGFGQEDIDELLASLDSNYLGWSSAIAPLIVGHPERPELGAELTASFCRTDPSVARHFAQVTFRSDNRADLDQLTTPTLVLQARDDVIAPEEVGEFVAARVRNATYRLLDATGHCPNLSAPAEVTSAIDDFLGLAR
jgi:sigma-B regulation protein RsbQ